ncbi:uncharacterized protein LOC123887538 [Trifolium pratense]|uniref:uncharacterized protein LOC123887538 n=1 Tax=Trifolium pratense TaxID=57577 RepID=UPI001E6942E6|nr:uncharacterized protein LOC123887538 [Trifolium pratense]
MGDIDDVDINPRIPDDVMIPSSDNPIASIVTAIYSSITDNMKDPIFFTPKNSIVDLINEYMLSLIDDEEKVYLSYDSPENDNADPAHGLCNGTRLIVTKMRQFIIEGKIILGSNIGDVFIPRLSLTPSDVRIPFKFQRRQFPIIVSFAMTINKS